MSRKKNCLMGFRPGLTQTELYNHRCQAEAQWPSGRASDSDSGARGRGLILTRVAAGCRVLSLSKKQLPPKSTGNTQEAVAPSRHD